MGNCFPFIYLILALSHGSPLVSSSNNMTSSHRSLLSLINVIVLSIFSVKFALFSTFKMEFCGSVNTDASTWNKPKWTSVKYLILFKERQSYFLCHKSQQVRLITKICYYILSNRELSFAGLCGHNILESLHLFKQNPGKFPDR